jgi:transcriptional regulator with XRE-family HTH domain
MNARKELVPMASAVAARLDAIRDRAGVRGNEVAQMLDTRPETVSRWRSGRAEPRAISLQRLLELAYLAEELGEFYNPADARVWLFSPHRLLGGERPVDRIQQGKIGGVLALVAQLRDGAFL